jgi:hypothetical protein
MIFFRLIHFLRADEKYLRRRFLVGICKLFLSHLFFLDLNVGFLGDYLCELAGYVFNFR